MRWFVLWVLLAAPALAAGPTAAPSPVPTQTMAERRDALQARLVQLAQQQAQMQQQLAQINQMIEQTRGALALASELAGGEK